MKKVAAFFLVVLFYVFVALGFTWAENTGTIDKMMSSLGFVNSNSIVSNNPVPPPNYPEPGSGENPNFASNNPVPPPNYPEPGSKKPKFA